MLQNVTRILGLSESALSFSELLVKQKCKTQVTFLWEIDRKPENLSFSWDIHKPGGSQGGGGQKISEKTLHRSKKDHGGGVKKS